MSFRVDVITWQKLFIKSVNREESSADDKVRFFEEQNRIESSLCSFVALTVYL